MSTFVHPSSLNKFRQFVQACGVLRETTRATNPAWYQEALDLPVQLHIRVDGPGITSYLFTRADGQWQPGPVLDEACLREPARMAETAIAALNLAQSRQAAALGVILHLADEFATAELKPELDNPAALPDLREAAIKDPASILADSSINPEQSSWRVLPYPGQGSQSIGTTIALSRQYASFIDVLRQTGETHNFPLVGCALSSPLVLMMGLPQLLPLEPGKSFVTILQYPWFTALVFCNEHADLMLIRTLQHRYQHRPANLRHALATTHASLEMVDPDLFILSLGETADHALESDLASAFPASRVKLATPATPAGIPTHCLELQIAATPPAQPTAVTSHTFEVLRNDQWGTQNFLPIPVETVEIFPNRSEMLLLRATRMAWVGLAAVAVLVLGWFALGMIDIVRKEEWSFDPNQTGAIKTRLAKLTTERQKTQQWDNLLEDRSKAWCSMELLSRLFPERSGMLVRNFGHTTKPESAPGKARVGFIKEWKITGLAREEALDTLNLLNTQEGVAARFSDIAKITGNAAFDPAVGNRSIAVNVRIQENNTFKPGAVDEIHDLDESTYGYSFDLTITQRYEATDPMALNTTRVP